jgi:hypothetical protein
MRSRASGSLAALLWLAIAVVVSSVAAGTKTAPGGRPFALMVGDRAPSLTVGK